MNQLKLSYAQQLKRPEWQNCSNSLKNEAGWKCELCGGDQHKGEVSLSIHHTYYLKDTLLWKYPRCLLMCLCDPCHIERQKLEEEFFVCVANVTRDLTNDQLRNQPIFTMFTQE